MTFADVVSFFGHPFFQICGGLFVLYSIFVVFYTLYIVVKGVIPVWYRLGMALSKNKIAIFSDSDSFNNLRGVLVDSKLFKQKQISHIDINSIGSAESKDLFVLHWKSFKEEIDAVMKIKDDHVGLIIYAPQDEGRIDDENIKKIGKYRNVTIVNFRGRFLQDVFVSMITTRYSRK